MTRLARFEKSVLPHLDAAYNLARWLLRDADVAEDVVQEAALRAFRFFDGMHGSTPKSWLMAIVRNACLDSMALVRRRGIEESFDEAAHGATMLDAAERHDTPESVAMQADDVRLLHAGLAALPREYREVLVLREMEGMSYREISSIVGVPMGTVMSRLSRGRDQLAALMRATEKRKSS